jgi:SAM-dependent methyltransferase
MDPEKSLTANEILSTDRYNWVVQDCPVCEKPPTRLIGKRGGAAHRSGAGVTSNVWLCKDCGMVFPNPMPVPIDGLGQHYDIDADDYFQHHDQGAKFSNVQVLLDQAADLVGAKGLLLDIGAGRGELLKSARDSGWECVGIEPSSTFAEYATRISGATIYREPVESCNFPESSFDVVILAAVLEHLYDPNGTIKTISRILRKGGALFIDVPNEQGLYFRVGNLYQKFNGRDWVVNLAPTFPPFHLFGFGKKSLCRLLKKHGLEPTKLRFYGGQSNLQSDASARGSLEVLASRLVSAVSNMGRLGTYIETWAIKQ